MAQETRKIFSKMLSFAESPVLLLSSYTLELLANYGLTH